MSKYETLTPCRNGPGFYNKRNIKGLAAHHLGPAVEWLGNHRGLKIRKRFKGKLRQPRAGHKICEHNQSRPLIFGAGNALLGGMPVSVDFVLLQFVIKGGAAHFEHLGGLAFITVGSFDRMLNVGLFSRRCVFEIGQRWAWDG